MSQVGNIIQGHFNELLGRNEDLSEQRLKICHSCPLYLDRLGGICNDKLWMDPVTEDVSLLRIDGYVRGCHCRVNAKTRLVNAECPAGKW